MNEPAMKEGLRWLRGRGLPFVLVVAGLAGGYWLASVLAPPGTPHGAHYHDHGHEHGEAAGSDTAAAETMYTCSMHPQVRSPDPDDRCPICGMELIPVATDDDGHADHDHDGPVLRVSPRSAALMQVEVLPVKRREVHVPVRVSGRLEADETRLRTISAWLPGRLERLHVDFTGRAVARGQPMVELYSPQLIAAQEELLQALAAAQELEARGTGVVRERTLQTVEASRDRLRLLGLDDAQVRRLEQRGRPEDRVTIPAPVSGVVMERLASEGDYVQTGQPIYRLADLSVLWAQLEVYEIDLPWLAPGQEASFSIQGLPGRQFDGRVTFIDPAVNEASRTARVRVEIANEDGRLKPGMFVRGVIHAAPTAAGEGTLVIPASAPLLTGRRALVYVQLPATERPSFVPREVVLGPRAGDWYIVEEGLEEGELVVARGAFRIDAELQIRGEPSMMQPEGGAPPGHHHGDHADHTDHADHANHSDHAGHAPRDVARHVAPEGFKQELGAMVQAQFALVRALADDDPAAAARTLAAIDAALHAVDGAALEAGDARRDWNRLAATMHDALGDIGQAPGIAGQRRHFETFSDALTEAVQAFGIAGAGTVYRAVCPMVQGRDGYWLQDEETIWNPYYGATMLRCGWIHETIDGNGS